MDTERRIVVGVNGSVSAKAALYWAVEQAELTARPLPGRCRTRIDTRAPQRIPSYESAREI
ncbi:hypothetical protein [Saccharopolyspora hattusasensis]|uniref:hypothetical protein n=1 Tax=Saccharopolyspora hattusasensis TaxID=1128679 RepID=UPI003D9940C4